MGIVTVAIYERRSMKEEKKIEFDQTKREAEQKTKGE